MHKKTLIIGAGGVGNVVAFKYAMNVGYICSYNLEVEGFASTVRDKSLRFLKNIKSLT